MSSAPTAWLRQGAMRYLAEWSSEVVVLGRHSRNGPKEALNPPVLVMALVDSKKVVISSFVAMAAMVTWRNGRLPADWMGGCVGPREVGSV